MAQNLTTTMLLRGPDSPGTEVENKFDFVDPRVLMELPSSLPLRSINAFFATLYSAAKGVLYYSILVPG